MAARRGSAREQRGRAWRTRRWPGAGQGGGGASVRRLQQRSAGPTRGGGPAGGSAQSRRRVRASQQATRGQARGPAVRGAERKRRAGAVARRGSPAGGCAGVPTMLQQHTRVSRGGSVREQEDPTVRRGVGIASRSGSIVSSHGSMTSSSRHGHRLPWGLGYRGGGRGGSGSGGACGGAPRLWRTRSRRRRQ
jgi:hypothetical protein